MGQRGPKSGKAFMAAATRYGSAAIAGPRADLPPLADPPVWLAGEAMRCWRMLEPECRLTPTCWTALVRYCVLWSQWVDARELVGEGNSGLTEVSGESGATTTSGAMRTELAVSKELGALERLLALSADVRGRLAASAPKAKPASYGPRPGPEMRINGPAQAADAAS